MCPHSGGDRYSRLARLIWQKWNEIFKEKLGQSERNYVSELMTARNDWAHQNAFTTMMLTAGGYGDPSP